MVYVGDGTVLEFYSWQQWPSSAHLRDDASEEESEDSEEEDPELVSQEDTRAHADRMEVGFRRYNLYDWVPEPV